MEEEIAVIGHSWPAHLGVFICNQVYEGAEVRFCSHDRDGDLQFMCGSNEGHDVVGSCKIAGLCHLAEHHPEILSIPSVHLGQWAERQPNAASWTIGISPVED